MVELVASAVATVAVTGARFSLFGVTDAEASDAATIAPAPMAVPSLNPASLVPKIFHLVVVGTSPAITDHAAYAILLLHLSVLETIYSITEFELFYSRLIITLFDCLANPKHIIRGQH